jgi:uncharacterized protein (TIGR03118 family)
MEVQMLKRAISSLCVVFLALLIPVAAASGLPGGSSAHPATSSHDNAYRQKNLVSDVPGWAAQVDPNLVNAWGLVAGPTSPWWVANEGTNTSTLYTGDGAAIPLVVRVGGGPTGTVFNGGTNFVVSHDGASGPALFLFATLRGMIRAWNPGVPAPAPSTRAFTVVNRSGKGAVYTGLAIASGPQGDRLYAADFANGRVDVFDGDFDLVRRSGAFADPHLPDGYGPFGIQAIRNRIFVAYAKQGEEGEEETGHGLGFVDMFSARGRLLARVASRHELNAPWGLAWAPAHFGEFSGDLLVGNFGDGEINAYRWGPHGFSHDGVLKRPNGHVIRIDGLWAIEFGNGEAAGPTTSLFFTAGPDEESHGLFGRIVAADRD